MRSVLTRSQRLAWGKVRQDIGTLCEPTEGVLDASFQRLLWGPGQYLPRPIHPRERTRGVPRSAWRVPNLDSPADDGLEHRDELLNRGAGTSTKIDHLTAVGTECVVEPFDGREVGLRQVPDVDVVSDPRSVPGRKINAREQERFSGLHALY